MRTFSKSDFKLARDCAAKLTWRERGYPDTTDANPYLGLLAEGGYMIEQLARLLFPEGRELMYDPRRAREAWETTRTALASDGTWFEATLLDGVQLARVDVLRKQGNRFDLFEVKSKSFSDETSDGPAGPFRAKRSPHGILAPWRPYLEDVTYQVHVLQRCFPEAEIHAHLIIVNKDAVASVEAMPRLFEIRRGHGDDEKDLDVRFIGDPNSIDPGELLATINVDAEVAELLADVQAFADEHAARYEGSTVAHVAAEIGMHCGKCEFRADPDVAPSGFHECWGRLAPTGTSVLDLYKFGMTKHGDEKVGDLMIRNGRIGLDEVDPTHLVKRDGSPTAASARQLVQIRHTQSRTRWVGPDLGQALESVQYPLHFIDFETSALAVPYHKGMRPYQSIGFQWSCHTVSAPGEAPVHREWLNITDLWPTREFVTTLRNVLGDAGTVLMWSPFERTILRQAREQLVAYDAGTPDLLDWLEPFAEKDHPETRLVDQHRLCEQHYFHPEMHGRTSIKWVLDAIWQDDPTVREQFTAWMGDDAFVVPDSSGPYEAMPGVTVAGTTLNVADGTGAMRAYQAMLYGDPDDRATQAALWADLLRRYCKLDTLAMVLIWEHWRRVA